MQHNRLLLLALATCAMTCGSARATFDDGRFAWQASGPLLAANTNAPAMEVAVKDPSLVFHDGCWHLFTTVRRRSGPVDIQYATFVDWRDASRAPRVSLKLHDQYYCAPQVFFYTPQACWYLIYQLADTNHTPQFGPCYSATTNIADPASWTKPAWLGAVKPETSGWLDFWVIGDATTMHLFHTACDGTLWRSATSRADFPQGWSKPVLALQGDIFEAAHTYKLFGTNLYLTIIEAQGSGRRYYKAYLADRLAGPWHGLADTLGKPFAAAGNVTQAQPWTANISHGEVLRAGIDERLEVDPAHLRVVFQGASDAEYRASGGYGKIPWRLGMLTPATAISPPARAGLMEIGTNDLTFVDARDLRIVGRPFDATGLFYSRLPATADGVVPEPVWNLAQLAAGIAVEFWSDTTVLGADLELVCETNGPPLNRDCTVDCYVHDGKRWGWLGILKDLARPRTQGIVCRGLPRERRLFRIYLPYAAQVQSLRIGVEAGAVLEPAMPPARKPICFYGTSIVHGYSASRAGMTMPAQVSRRLDWPVWNLGFSGNARMENALADLLAKLDPAVYVLDCLPNMLPDLVTERTIPFIRALRAARPATPIVLVENIVYQATYVLEDKRGGWGPKNDALRAAYEQLRKEGVANLYYVKGDDLLGSDGDATVDGTHPTDLGFYRMADVFERALRPLLKY